VKIMILALTAVLGIAVGTAFGAASQPIPQRPAEMTSFGLVAVRG
jgi:hypothetical protein